MDSYTTTLYYSLYIFIVIVLYTVYRPGAYVRSHTDLGDRNEQLIGLSAR